MSASQSNKFIRRYFFPKKMFWRHCASSNDSRNGTH